MRGYLRRRSDVTLGRGRYVPPHGLWHIPIYLELLRGLIRAGV